MSERPKVQLSKSCVDQNPPWVQIPPSPLITKTQLLSDVTKMLLGYSKQCFTEGMRGSAPV